MKKTSLIAISLLFYALTFLAPSLSHAITPANGDLEKRVIAQVQDFLNETQKGPFQIVAKNITFTPQNSILVLKDVSFTFKEESFYNTGTISTLTFKDFDYTVFESGVDTTNLYTIASTINIEALATQVFTIPESANNKTSMTVASIELHNLACRLDDLNEKKATLAAAIPHYISIFAFDKALVSNITVRIPQHEKMTVRAKINAILFENLRAGVLKYTEINNLLVDSPILFIALDAGKIYENHLAEGLLWLQKTEADREKDVFANLLQATFTGGMDLTNVHASVGNSPLFSFDSFLSRSQYGAEYTYSHKIKGLTINTDFFGALMGRSNAALLNTLDISSKKIDQTFELSLNKQQSTLTVPNFTTSIENFGLFQTTFTVANTDSAKILGEGDTALKNFTFIYTDDGYIPTLIQHLAASRRQNVDSYMVDIVAIIDILFADSLENSADNEAQTTNLLTAKKAILSFIKNPQEITLTFLPDGPFVFADSEIKILEDLEQQMTQGKIKIENKELQ